MTQPEFSVELGFFLANPDQRGISRGLYIPATYDEASDYISDIMRNIIDNGNITMSNIAEGGKYRFGDGTVTAPALSWTQDTDSGRYRIGAGNIGESIDGVKAYDWNGTRLRLGALDLDWVTDNAEDIGATGANRPRDIYLGGNVIWASGTSFQATFDHAHTVARTHTYPDATGTLVQYTVAAATGDLLYWGGGPNWNRLTVGAASTLLKSDGTNPSWGTVSLLSAFHGDTTAGVVARGDLVVGQDVAATWKRLALGASARVLRSDGTDAVWAQVVLTTDVTGTLPIANGGTGGTTAAAARTNLGAAVDSASYITVNAEASLSGESTLNAGDGISLTAVVGAVTVNAKIATQAEQETATSVITLVSPGRQQYHPSAAKAWVVWTTSGGTVTTQASYGVSSITDNGTGDLTVNFTTAFSTANYAAGSMANVNTSGAGTEFCIVGYSNTVDPTITACRMLTVRIGTQDAQDTKRGAVAFYGDQ